MIIYDALKKDHEKVKQLLSKLVQATEHNDETKNVLKQIRDELIPHARAEEAVFYNAIRETEEGKKEVMHGYTEHAKAETLLRTLQGMSMINIEWTSAAKKLQEEVEHHIQEEEGKIFSVARKVLSEEEATQIGQAFESLKPQVKEEGLMKNTFDLVANLMPKRFADKFKKSA